LAKQKTVRSKPAGGKYRLGGTNALFSTTLVLPKAEAENLRRLHARLLLDLVSLPNGGRRARFSQASTIRVSVRYLLEHLRTLTGKVGDPSDRLNVFLLRHDLPELLKLQAQLMARQVESSRSLVLRCAVDLLDQALKRSSTWMRIVKLAKEAL
jgi:hypothetical protein